MAVDAGEDDRAVPHHGVDVGGGGEAAEAPALLIPAAALHPERRGMLRRIGSDAGLGVRQRCGVVELEAQRHEAQLHDMAVRVDQTGDQVRALGVEAEIELFRALVALLQEASPPGLRG